MIYRTRGTCSQLIEVELDGTTIKHVQFTGGCNGNLKGISRLVEGMDANEAIRKLEGTDCNGRGTTCPDQPAKDLKQASSA